MKIQREADGFTLIEVMVVAVITVMLAGFLITNFSRSRNELSVMVTGIISDIREVQGLAISGAAFGGVLRCGYGIVFQEDRYILYAGPEAIGANCDPANYTFEPGFHDVIREVVPVGGVHLISTGDVFFEPPLPYTYLNGARGREVMSISVSISGAGCPSSSCRTVNITPAGRIYLTQ